MGWHIKTVYIVCPVFPMTCCYRLKIMEGKGFFKLIFPRSSVCCETVMDNRWQNVPSLSIVSLILLAAFSLNNPGWLLLMENSVITPEKRNELSLRNTSKLKRVTIVFQRDICAIWL